jgi:uncharacterized protein (TIGR03083 family)
MTLSTDACIAAIRSHSAGFADATRGNLDARVEHCPDWSVADLVEHLTEVHWFWRTVADELPDAPPDESRRPDRSDDAGLVEAFERGAAQLVDVLASADQSAACWTWAPQQQDVAFITRHQVQEAAVHHWDAVNAAGGSLTIEPEIAADAVDEFLSFSVTSDEHPEEWAGKPLTGTFALRATDTGGSWTVTDGTRPGTVRTTRGESDGPVVEATAADLLLWLYGRVELDTAVPGDLVARFRALCGTD